LDDVGVVRVVDKGVVVDDAAVDDVDVVDGTA